MSITKEELAKAQGCSVEEIDDGDIAAYEEEYASSQDRPPEDVDDDIEVEIKVDDVKPDKKDESEADDDIKIKSEADKVVTDDTDTSTETKDELPDEFKDRYVLKEAFTDGDPIGDKDHPLHQIAVENSKATRAAITDKRQAETERDDAIAALANIDVDSENNPKTGVYGGKTIDEARDDGKEHEWYDDRDSYRAVQKEKERQKSARDVSDREYEERKKTFFETNPDINQEEFLGRYDSNHGGTISFEQCQTLDSVKSGGGIEAMLKVARDEGFAEGAKKGSSDTLSVVSENTTKSDAIKASDGKSKNTSSKGEFKLKSAIEMQSMTDKQWDEYDAELRKAEEDGRTPKIGGY